MKYFGVIALAVIATFAICTYAQSHNVNWGRLGLRNVLKHREVADKKIKFLQIVEGDVVIQGEGLKNCRSMDDIPVDDGYKNGKGGYAVLVLGGIGNRNLTVDMFGPK